MLPRTVARHRVIKTVPGDTESLNEVIEKGRLPTIGLGQRLLRALTLAERVKMHAVGVCNTNSPATTLVLCYTNSEHMATRLLNNPSPGLKMVIRRNAESTSRNHQRGEHLAVMLSLNGGGAKHHRYQDRTRRTRKVYRVAPRKRRLHNCSSRGSGCCVL
jgi:hypothetical protein